MEYIADGSSFESDHMGVYADFKIKLILSASINYNMGAKALHSYWSPQIFIQKFQSCMVDTKCKIYCRHVEKIGGTYVESVFFIGTFPLNRKYIKNKGTCCFSAMVKRLEENKKDIAVPSFHFTKSEDRNFSTLYSVIKKLIEEHEN